MSRRGSVVAVGLAATLLATMTLGAPAEARGRGPRQTLFVGVDTSGSFSRAGYDDALEFLAYYIYGHLHGLGGLAKPRQLFVAAIGGTGADEPKAFHPIHDFIDKDVERLQADLRGWFPPTDTLTDFNAFFVQVARVARERNLLLTRITVIVVSDGIPDVASPAVKAGSTAAYQRIDLSELEYLARSVTLRLAYASPVVGQKWRKLVPRRRVRFWAVDREIMGGWREQMKPEIELASQDRLWKWVKENVDFRVRRGL